MNERSLRISLLVGVCTFALLPLCAALTWNSTHVSPFAYTVTSPLTDLIFECIWSDGTYYISRTTTSITIVATTYYIYTCWVFTKVTSNKYTYQIMTSPSNDAQQKLVKLLDDTITVSAYGDVCDDTTKEINEYSVLLKNDTASSEKIRCPDPLSVNGAYTMTDHSGTAYCNDVSELTACSSTGVISVNYTTCATQMFYSAGGEAYCMYSTGFSSSSDTSTYYVTMWNTDSAPDQSSTFYFSCVVVTSTSELVYFTTYPQECLLATAQNSTLMTTSPGYSVVVNTTATCPLVIEKPNPPVPTSEDDTTLIVGICIGIVIFLALVALIIFLVYKFCYLKKKEGRSISKIEPDTLPNTAMSTADRNKRMMFTPAPPKSAGPGGRQQEYYDDRCGSELSMRPTVSQLACYRTPTPYISDSKVPAPLSHEVSFYSLPGSGSSRVLMGTPASQGLPGSRGSRRLTPITKKNGIEMKETGL